MEGEARTSHEVNDNEISRVQSWTRNLQGFPAFNYELLTKHLGAGLPGSGTSKHNKL